MLCSWQLPALLLDGHSAGDAAGLSAGHGSNLGKLDATGARQPTACVKAMAAGWLAGSHLPAAILQMNKNCSGAIRTALDSLYSASFSSRVLRRVSKLGTLL